jgi:energy-coupling factor transport system substrate-specific component
VLYFGQSRAVAYLRPHLSVRNRILLIVVLRRPDARGLRGEAGLSPALSRNCEDSTQYPDISTEGPYLITDYCSSQVTRHDRALRTFAERGWVPACGPQTTSCRKARGLLFLPKPWPKGWGLFPELPMQRILNAAILAIASLIGLVSFLYPFLVPQQGEGFGVSAHAQDALLIFVVLVVLCLGAAVSSLSAGMMNAKLIAVLGVLTAANAVLRGVPGPAGFTLVFLLPILCGYVYGPTFGFLLGVFSLAVSAFLGFGVGPWLPYQMFAAGWVGLLSGWLPRLNPFPAAEAFMLALWGLILGFAFGVLMNVYFWPYVFAPGQSEMYWQPGLTLIETLQRYTVFYVLTSLWWDLARAVGNFVLLLIFAAPVVRLLRRFQQRFSFQVQAQ